MGVDSWVSSPLLDNMIIALSIDIIIVSFISILPNVVNSQSVLSRQDDDQYCGPGGPRPTFVGIINTATTLEWEGGCFKDYQARLELRDTRNGVATVSLQVKKLGVALFKLPSLGTERPQGYRDM